MTELAWAAISSLPWKWINDPPDSPNRSQYSASDFERGTIIRSLTVQYANRRYYRASDWCAPGVLWAMYEVIVNRRVVVCQDWDWPNTTGRWMGLEDGLEGYQR